VPGTLVEVHAFAHSPQATALKRHWRVIRNPRYMTKPTKTTAIMTVSTLPDRWMVAVRAFPTNACGFTLVTLSNLGRRPQSRAYHH
jgi:hypothetical protein